MLHLDELLLRSHLLPPDQLAAEVADWAERQGLADLVIYLINYEQSMLVPLPAAGREAPSGALPVDVGPAGVTYRTGEVTAAEAPDVLRLHVSLLDGGERLGVMAVTVAVDDQHARRDCEVAASLVALLIVSKQFYTDSQEMTRRSRDLDLAAEAQRALLPPLTFLHPRLAIAGVLENAYETGGDAFDYALNGRIAHFGIFDAMGHGLAASLLAATVVTAYRNGRRRGMKLAESFAAISATVAAQHSGGQFVTAQLGELDIETGDLTWINGGHPLPFLVRDGSVVGRLRCEPSLPLGLGGPVAEIASERLQPGDRLVFFSDGVVEARARDGEPFGEDRLAELLAAVGAARIRPAETMRQLVRAVLVHQGSKLKDDASLLLVEWAERS